MKAVTEKKAWSFAGIFMMMLIVSMPFYSAGALAASVQITKNQGEAGIETYLDAEGDVWTVEALIGGLGTPMNGSIDPRNVKIKIGENEAPFKSCSQSSLGHVCEYLSPLTDGVMEGEYAFQVIYSFLNMVGKMETTSNGDIIRADGSEPEIFFAPGDVRQNKDGEVEIDFTVGDKKRGFPSVGLQKIEVIDADSNLVLQTITDLEDKEVFNYAADNDLGSILPAEFSGEGIKRIKIRAADRLGHSAVSPAVQFFSDFVKPEISDDLNFTRFGDFIGQFTGTTSIKIDVVEASVPVVKGYSSQAELDGDEALCEADAEEDKLWHCVWSGVEVRPESTVTVLVVVKDEKGNVAERSLSKTFTVDNSPPKIKFFGTLRQFEGRSYFKSGENKLILRAEDQGAGISKDGIRANLGAFDLSPASEPDACEEKDGILECYWDIDENLNEGVLTFGLSRFEDNVGNEGEAPEFEFMVDNTGPKVEKIGLFGVSEAGEKEYFQSNDIFKMVLRVSESSGLRVLVNVNDLVLDAETKYPENEFIDEDGWQIFTEENCVREEGRWECILETDAIKSGPDPSVDVEMRVQDTAGNDARSWPDPKDEPSNVQQFRTDDKRAAMTIDLIGLLTEDNPDYWEVRNVVPLGGESAFIDLDTTQLTYTRLPFKVVLNSDLDNVQSLDIELADCLPEEEAAAEGETAPASTNSNAPVISRALLYGGISPAGDYSPTPTVIIEFEPFNGRELFNIGQKGETKFEKEEVLYICTLKIFSQVGKNAVRAAEIQEVEVLVPFAFSFLGAQDENLGQIIENARDDINVAWDIIGVIAEILKWVDYLVQIYNIVVGIITLFVDGPIYSTEGLRAAKLWGGDAAATAFCFGFTGASASADKGVDIIDAIVQVLSCRPSEDLGWYGQWQAFILNLYNVEMLGKVRGPGDPLTMGTKVSAPQFRQARDIRENLFLSIAGLCLPGIIKNVDQFRQIKCRKIVCLENEVRSGLATVSMCEEMEDMLVCKYVLGEAWSVIPFLGFYDQVVKALARAFADPFAMFHTLNIVGCGIACTASNTVSGFCTYSQFIWQIIDVLESVVGFITTVIAEFESGGLNYCDAAGVDVL